MFLFKSPFELQRLETVNSKVEGKIIKHANTLEIKGGIFFTIHLYLIKVFMN